METLPQAPFVCTLEILAENQANPDPAALATLATLVVAGLQDDGAAVKPASAGRETKTRRSPDLLFQVVWQSLQTVGADILAQKDAIDVLASVCTTFATVSPLITRLFRTHEQRPKQGQHGELKVSITIDQASIEITAVDVADDERIVQLAQRFLATYPTANISKKSKVKVQVRVPQQHQRHSSRHRR